MDFAWAWCFLALPLPWLMRHWLAPVNSGTALRMPSLPAELPEAASPVAPSRWIAVLVWLLLVTAAARPQAPGDMMLQPVSGRDLMLAIDVSASMATADMQLDGRPIERLHAARRFADDFLARRQGDRVGLIVFGTNAYLHTPLTFDRDAVSAALATTEIGLAGRETALGDAIGLATKHLKELPDSDRVLILLTDGANTAGTLEPLRAAWLAQREGVRIHVVGIGALTAAGEAATGLDEKTLQGIAGQTGGSYQRATDSAALDAFFQRLDRIEPAARGADSVRPIREFYAWPLGLALALTCWLAWRRTREDPA